ENYLIRQNALYYCDDICIFTDYNIYNNFLAENYRYKPRWLNKKYLVTCLKAKGIFHPKLYIFASEKKALIGIGSANLTRDGIASNLELVSSFEVSKNDLTYSHILRESINYVKRLAELSRSKTAIEKVNLMEEICIPFFENRESYETKFIHNLDRSILDQIEEFVGKNSVTDISIISPFFDEKLAPLNKLLKIFPDADVDLFIQQAKSNFPLNQIENLVNSTGIMLFGNTDRYIHGKCIIFKLHDKNIFFCGSANFTRAALLSTAKDGNFEIGLIGNISEEKLDEVLNPHGQKAERLMNKSDLKVETKSEMQSEDYGGFVQFIFEAERIENTIVLSVNNEISREKFTPHKFRLFSFDGAEVEIDIEKEFIIPLDSKLKKKNDCVDGIQIIGHNINQDVIKSNIAWVVNLEIRKTKGKARYRKIYNNPFELSSILEEMWKTGNIEDLREFLISFDIPLDLILPPRQSIPKQRESKGNVEGQIPLHRYRLLFQSDSIIGIYRYFLDLLYKKLEKHNQNPQIDKFSNFMLIISALFSFLDFIDYSILDIYAGNEIISANDWAIVRDQYNLLFNYVEKCWGLIFLKDGYREHLNEKIQRDQEQDIENDVHTFESYIIHNEYDEQILSLFEISKNVFNNFISLARSVKIKTEVGTIVQARLFAGDNHLCHGKETLDIILKNESFLNSYFNQQRSDLLSE
ncbi:hypothetical protein ACFLQZ_03225, partial [Acidobacteriota bacterium]